MNIILTGSLAIDRIMNFPGQFQDHIIPDKVHQLNVAFNIDRLDEKNGGTAGNIAYSLSLLGEQPIVVAAAGNDFDHYIDHLQSHALPIEGIEIQKNLKTASAYITTDQNDNQITAFDMGAMVAETHFDLSTLSTDDIIVFSAGNKMDMLNYSRKAKKQGIRYFFDPGQTLPFFEVEELQELIDGAYMLFVNDYELQMVVNRTGWSEDDVRAKVTYLITTLGKEGSRIEGAGEKIEVGVSPVADVLDPTGAGDAYRAGFLKGFMYDLPLVECGQLGAVASAYVIEQRGTQEHFYEMEAFSARYTEAFGTTYTLPVY